MSCHRGAGPADGLVTRKLRAGPSCCPGRAVLELGARTGPAKATLAPQKPDQPFESSVGLQTSNFISSETTATMFLLITKAHDARLGREGICAGSLGPTFREGGRLEWCLRKTDVTQ